MERPGVTEIGRCVGSVFLLFFQANMTLTRDDLEGLAVTVMGLGQFGGGVAAARFLSQHGARVTVTDHQPEEQLKDSLQCLGDVDIEKLVIGRHHEADFSECDLLVANPAVPPDHRLLTIANKTGVPIETEVSLFWKFLNATTICVTGSNGKSTTTSLIYEMLKRSERSAGQRVWLGGNIGKSLLPDLDRIQPDDIVVLELSSFQLHYLNRLKIRPDVAVVTNFSPNHLDWHKSLGDYRSSKQSVLRWQDRSNVAIVPAVDDDVDQWPTAASRRVFGLNDNGEDGVFGVDGHVVVRLGDNEEAVRWPDCPQLPGNHNRRNIAAAICAATSVGASLVECADAVKSFQTLPHRLQLAGVVNDRRFYNDSISTTPESTCAAVDAFASPVVLLAGGYDKHLPLDSMAKKIAEQCKSVVLMGQTALTLQQLICEHQMIPCIVAKSMESAVRSAYELSEPGDIVVLSPGCASYDWFVNFQERGERFQQLVTELP